MVNGNISQIWKEKRQVKIGESWFKLAEHVKLDFVKMGPVSFSLSKEEPDTITFVKSVTETPQGPPTYPEPEQKPYENELPNIPVVRPGEPIKEEYKDQRQASIESQFAIREGLKMIEVYNQNSDEKMVPTIQNIRENARMVLDLLDSLR